MVVHLTNLGKKENFLWYLCHYSSQKLKRTVTACTLTLSKNSYSLFPSSGIHKRLELFQFRFCTVTHRWAFGLPMEHSSNLLKGLAFGLRNTEVCEESEDEKQPSKEDEHVTSKPSLKNQSQINGTKQCSAQILERLMSHFTCFPSDSFLKKHYKVDKSHFTRMSSDMYCRVVDVWCTVNYRSITQYYYQNLQNLTRYSL